LISHTHEGEIGKITVRVLGTSNQIGKGDRVGPNWVKKRGKGKKKPMNQPGDEEGPEENNI